VRRRVLQRRLRAFSIAEPFLTGRKGLEIGGPSSLFARGGTLPLYGIVAGLDNCNFSRTTVWAGAVDPGLTFVFDRRRPAGRQYIQEATDLAAIASASRSFLLASHTIEHCANPLAALREWTRVVDAGGLLVLVIPHKDGTFDHRRPITPLAHLVDDFERHTGEDDVTHVPEILAQHDLTLDPAAGSVEAFTARCGRNLENRCLHHHVFDTRLAVEMIDYAGLQLLDVEPTLPYHIVVVAQKPPADAPIDNAAFLAAAASFRRLSPFVSDRE